jgi:hypothetical protein
MSILTTSELEFLARLRSQWHQDYLIEVERLLKEDDDHTTMDQQPTDTGPPSRNSFCGAIPVRKVRGELR